MARFEIGDFDFVVMRGAIGLFKQTIQVIQRPNVDDFALRLLGNRGEPFQVITLRDAEDIEAARALIVAYGQLIGEDPVRFIWTDLDLELTEGHRVAVLAVMPVKLRHVNLMAGGLDTGSKALVQARWTLALSDVT